MTSQNHCFEGPRAKVLHWAPHLLGPALFIEVLVNAEDGITLRETAIGGGCIRQLCRKLKYPLTVVIFKPVVV